MTGVGACVLCVFLLVWDGLVGVRILGCPVLARCTVGWICVANGSIGCSNNNYASREKCKKCGQPKEVAAIPAIAMPGASLPTHAHYFARAHGGLGFKMNAGMAGNPNLQQSLPLNSSWPYGVSNKYPLHSAPGWSFGGTNGTAFPYANNASQVLMVPKGWRNGDWICNCGFHNYASRAQVSLSETIIYPTCEHHYLFDG